ncbi:MAG: glycosyltransferase family 39 protein [Ruminococcaceae bacterium]|nr:glycosyltransferase family 39 protein [Oscillospiraceae bacterium]
MSVYDIAFIAVAVLCYVLAFSKGARKRLDSIPLFKNAEGVIANTVSSRYGYFLAAVVLVGIAVRVWRFGEIPYGFNQDEAMAALEAASLAKNGTDHYGMVYPVYFTAWQTHQMNVLLSYITAVLFRLFGASIFVARLPLLIFSLISLCVVYFFSRRMLGKNAALVILFVFAVDPWHIMIGRWALESNLLPHLLLIGCYLMYLGMEKKGFMYLSMAVFGIAMYSYGTSYYMVPTLLLMLCIYLLRTKTIKWYDVLICTAVYAAVSWPIFVMMALNLFRLETVELPFMTIPFFEKGERLNDILFFSGGFFKQLGKNLLCTVCIVLFQVRDSAWNSIPSIGPFYYLSIPFLIMGFVFFVDELRDSPREKRRGIAIITMLFAAAFISGLITNHVNLNRINCIVYPVLFMVGYAIYIIIKKLKVTLVPIALMFSLLFGSFCNSYFFGEFSKELGREFYTDFVQSVNYVKEMDYEELHVTAKTQGENAEFVSEIMTQFLLGLDVRYTTGELLPDGELPYEDKYFYGISADSMDPEDIGAVYVIRMDEAEYFNKDIYDIECFGDYGVVTHKLWLGDS